MAQSHGVFLPKGSSIYYCTVQVKGKRKRTTTKCKSRKDAIAFARRWKQSLVAAAAVEAATEVSAGPQMAFLPAVNRYMKEEGEKKVAHAQYEAFFDWLVDRIGADTPLSAITNDVVARLMTERAGEYRYGNPESGFLNPTYVQRSVLIPLRTVLRRAKDLWEVSLPREPSWGRHKVKDRFRTRVMTWDEEAAIKAVADPDLWRLVEFILLTGLRREDALVGWSDVDRTARVIRTRIKGDKPFEVRITAGIRNLLDEAAAHSWQGDEIWTWVPTTGANARLRQPIGYGMFQQLWNATIRKAGVDGLTIHDIRRTAGERLYRATGDIAAVSNFLGHANVELTKKYYVHVRPDDVEERQLAMEWVRAKSLEEHASRRIHI